ncbi:AAA family ATPase [Streptomyces sp. NPDC059786]|uniref:AAA family ATPase n=1 Tax=Streptomyces sp. NPDC059786 TaxID=3346946 RepID=UPI003665650D
MYLSRISVRNVKTFHGPREVKLDLTRPDGSYAGWTVLAGRNGSGKTTLLRAVALAVTGPDNAHRLMPSFKAWMSEGAERADAFAEVVPAYEYDYWAVDGTDEQPPPSVPSAMRWEWRNPPAMGARGSRPAEPSVTSASGLALWPPVPGSIWDPQPVGWLLAGYGSFRRLSGGEGHRKPVGVLSRLGTLFDEDASLAEGVSWLVGQHLRALEGDEAAAELKATALAVLGDGLLPDGCRVVDVDSEGLWVDWESRRFPLREMSDGLRTITALVVDLLRQVYESYAAAREEGVALTEQRDGRTVVSVPGVVLIDEVDAHLHVSWQRRIGPWLTAHFPGIQFIVTTHSPYICQSADPGGLIRLPGPGEQTGPQVVDEDLYERVVYGSGDDAALSELFGLDSPYSEKAEALRAELVALEGQVLRGDADAAALARYTRIKQLLTSSPSARLDEMSARLSLLAEEGARPADGGHGE